MGKIKGTKDSSAKVMESSGLFPSTIKYLTKASDQITMNAQEIANMSLSLEDKEQNR